MIFVIALICSQNSYARQSENLLQIFSSCWFYPTSQTEDFKIASDNVESLFVPLLNGKLISLSPYTLQKSWETDLAGVFASDPLISENSIYIVVKTSNDKLNADNRQDSSPLVIYSLNKTTGITQWQTKLTLAYGTIHILNSDDCVILIGDNGDVHSVAKVDGVTIWKKSLETGVSSLPFKNKENIIIGTMDNHISTLVLESGQLIEKVEVSAPPTIIFEDKTGNNLIVGDKKGYFKIIKQKEKNL